MVVHISGFGGVGLLGHVRHRSCHPNLHQQRTGTHVRGSKAHQRPHPENKSSPWQLTTHLQRRQPCCLSLQGVLHVLQLRLALGHPARGTRGVRVVVGGTPYSESKATAQRFVGRGTAIFSLCFETRCGKARWTEKSMQIAGSSKTGGGGVQLSNMQEDSWARSCKDLWSRVGPSNACFASWAVAEPRSCWSQKGMLPS